MAAVIPEAAGAVTSGEAAVSGAGAARAGSGARGAAAAGGVSSSGGGRKRRENQFEGRARRAGRGAARARVPGGRNYQPVILAEFLAAVLVVSLAPVAKGGTPAAKAKGGGSPYDTGSLKQLLLIGLVYFILALLSSGRNLGRFAAWFGGLVLVAVGIQQTASGGLAAVLHMFMPGVGSGLGSYPAAGDSGVLPPLNLNVGQFAPGALAAGVQQSPPPAITGIQQPPPGVSATVVNSVPDATGIFPTIEPGGSSTSSVVTNGLPPGVNLAL